MAATTWTTSSSVLQ